MKEQWKESEKPFAFRDKHYLEQIEIKGAYRSNKEKVQSILDLTSKPLIPLHVTISLTDITNINPVDETFTIKYRSYFLWEDDSFPLDDSVFIPMIEKSIESGHFYHLQTNEVEIFTQHYPKFPKIMIFNQISVQETDDLDIHISAVSTSDPHSSGTSVHGEGKKEERAEELEEKKVGDDNELKGSRREKMKVVIMINQSYFMICRERFILYDFPFDLQRLTLDICLRNSKVWKQYDLRIDSIQFDRQCLHQIEWFVCIPEVRKGNPKTLNSIIEIPVMRKSNFYLQNIIMITIILAALGLSTFAFQSNDLTGRTFISLTLILTCIAFKFTTLQGSLPRVPYSTIIDYFLTYTIWCLAMMTVFTIIPNFYTTSNEKKVDGVYALDGILNLILSMISIGLVVIGFGSLLLYSYVKRRIQHTECRLIPLDHQKKERQWYSFHYTNGSHLLDFNENEETVEKALFE